MSDEETKEQLIQRWVDAASKLLLGCEVIDVRYMTDKEQEALGWSCKPAVLTLKSKDGKKFAIYPSSDDEGNDAGALFTTKPQLPVIPVIWR